MTHPIMWRRRRQCKKCDTIFTFGAEKLTKKAGVWDSYNVECPLCRNDIGVSGWMMPHSVKQYIKQRRLEALRAIRAKKKQEESFDEKIWARIRADNEEVARKAQQCQAELTFLMGN